MSFYVFFSSTLVVREAFCSYATIKLATIYSSKMIAAMKVSLQLPADNIAH